jgi:hypothetical protein
MGNSILAVPSRWHQIRRTPQAAGYDRRSSGDRCILVYQRCGNDRRNHRRRNHLGRCGYRGDQHDRRGGPQASASVSPPAVPGWSMVLVLGPVRLLVVGPSGA